MKVQDILRIKALAREERVRLNISPLVPVDPFRIFMEIEGITLSVVDMHGDLSGFFLKKDDEGMVVLNANRSLGHQIFTAVHEYYHMRFDQGMEGRVCLIHSFDQDVNSETEANYFATYFLVPEEALEYHLERRLGGRGIEFADVIYLEQLFMVSHVVMLQRLLWMEVISQAQMKRWKPNIIRNARRLGYDGKLYQKTVLSEPLIFSDYAEIAHQLLKTAAITEGKYEEYLMEGGYFDLLIESEDEHDETEDAYRI
jgi:Zn-dependent peptidase ImmA (M78 family)